MVGHSWSMTSQDGERCEWTCSTHNPPCHKTTFDGKSSRSVSDNSNFEPEEPPPMRTESPTSSEKNFGFQTDFCFVCRKPISQVKISDGNIVWAHDVYPLENEHDAVLGKWVRADE